MLPLKLFAWWLVSQLFRELRKLKQTNSYFFVVVVFHNGCGDDNNDHN